MAGHSLSGFLRRRRPGPRLWLLRRHRDQGGPALLRARFSGHPNGPHDARRLCLAPGRARGAQHRGLHLVEAAVSPSALALALALALAQARTSVVGHDDPVAC